MAIAKKKVSGIAKKPLLTASGFIAALKAKSSAGELQKIIRFYREIDGPKNKFLGVRMGVIFQIAKEYTQLPVKDVAKLLDDPHYEVRMGAVSIMDFKAREKKITDEERKELFDLYIKKHNRINNWDLVDRSAPHVVGGYLSNRPRKILYQLAKSKDPWERRTSIVSTWYFIRQGDIEDTFKIAALLVKDKHDLVQKAVGSWIREAGKRDRSRLLHFLDVHAATMPRTMLRYAVEKMDRATRERILSLQKS